MSVNSFSGTETDLSSYTHESFVFYELHELIFAEALGIDLEEDYAADLLEVAAKAMQTLPEGWELEYTKANGVKIPYYIDTINRESHWTHPFFEDYKELIIERRQELLEEEEEGDEDDEEEEEYEEEEEEVEGIAMADEISMVTDSFVGDEIDDHSTIPDDKSVNSFALQEPITEEPLLEEPLLEEQLPEESLLEQTSLLENTSNKSNKSIKSIKSSSTTKHSQQISPRAGEEQFSSIPSSPFESIPTAEEKSNELESDDHSLQISVQSHKSNKSNKSNKQDNQSVHSEYSQKSHKSQPFALIDQNESIEGLNMEEETQNIETSQEIKQIEEINPQSELHHSEHGDEVSIHEPSPPMVSAISSVTQERNDDVSVSNTTIRSQISDPKLIIHESTEEQTTHIVSPKEEEPTKEFIEQSPSHSIQDKPSIAEVSAQEEEVEEDQEQEQETEAQESSYIVDEKNETDLVSLASETTKKSELSKEEAFLKNIGTLTFIDNFPDFFTVEDTILKELEQQIPVGSDSSNNDFDIDRMSSLLPPDTPKPLPFSSEYSLTSDENSSQVTNSLHKFEIIMDQQDNHSLNPTNNENSSILSSSLHENEHGFATQEEDDLNSIQPIQITGYDIQNPPLESQELPHEDSVDQFDNNKNNDSNLPHLMNILEDERFYQPPTPLDKSIDIRDHYLTMFRPVTKEQTNDITSQPNKETKANTINLPEISHSQQSNNNNKKLTNLLNNNLAHNVMNSPEKNFLPKLGNKLGIKKRSPKKKSPKKGEQSNDKQAPGWILLEAFDSFSEAEKVVHFFEKLYPSNSNVNKSFPIASRLMLPEEKDKINQFDASIKHVSTSIDRENLDKKTINMALGKELPKLRIARDLSRMQWLVECNDPQIKSTFNNKFVGKSPMKRKSILLSKLKTPPLNNYNMASQTIMITNSNTKHLSKVIPFTNPNTSPKRPNKMNLTSSSTTALFDYTDNNQNTALLRQTSVSSNGLRMSKLASVGNTVIQPNNSFLMPKDASISQAAQNWEGSQDGPKSIRASGPRSFNVLLTRPQSTSN